MEKIVAKMVLAGLLLLPVAANGQQSEAGRAGDRTFLQTNAWWNLYFSKENDPLRRAVNAVKVLEIDPNRPSWIKITFPASRAEHFSVFGPAAKAHEKNDVAFETAVAEWEKTIQEWKTIWVNLDYVVYATKVESEDRTKPHGDRRRRDR